LPTVTMETFCPLDDVTQEQLVYDWKIELKIDTKTTKHISKRDILLYAGILTYEYVISYID